MVDTAHECYRPQYLLTGNVGDVGKTCGPTLSPMTDAPELGQWRIYWIQTEVGAELKRSQEACVYIRISGP